VDEAERAALGERVEPAGRAPAPPPLRAVQQFINTWNHEFPAESDRLGTTTAAQAWLVDHGLLSPLGALGEADRSKLLRFREGLRRLLVAKQGIPLGPDALRTLNELTAPLEVLFDASGASYLRPTDGGAREVIGRLLSLVHEASVEGSWRRLKSCRTCGWVFYDGSKNCSGSWCSMSICGNRSKNRSYHRRASRR
jgi:predicted RNA-binding Zn ribbon-like protein